MISVLGLPLALAKQRLECENVSVAVTEVRSRKGMAGDGYRVLRQQKTAENAVLLTVADFQTKVQQ